jgi:hypothetical protein
MNCNPAFLPQSNVGDMKTESWFVRVLTTAIMESMVYKGEPVSFRKNVCRTKFFLYDRMSYFV